MQEKNQHQDTNFCFQRMSFHDASGYPPLNPSSMSMQPLPNIQRPLFNHNIPPPGFFPPSFRRNSNQSMPVPLPFRLMPPGRPEFSLSNHAPFVSGNSSGMMIRNPLVPPFPNPSNVAFSNSRLSNAQNFKPELPALTLPLHQQQSAKSSKVERKTADEIMVEQFLIKIGKLSKHNVKTQFQQTSTKYLKICEAKKLHCRAKYLISKLEGIAQSSIKSDNVKDLQQLRDELTSAMSVLSDKEIVEDLQRKIAARKKKRNRAKKAREKVFKEKLLNEQKIKEANKAISKWQMQEMENLEKKLREEELQKQLDSALLGMRRELSTISKSLDMINSLANLRKARLHSLKSKGKELPSSSVTERFNEKVQETKSMLLSYKRASAKKVNSLKMFLEAEHEQAKREIEKKKAKQQLELKQKLENERNFILFGESKELDPFDPMWPVQELHKQAELNLPALVQYRRLWDQYLHPDGTTLPYGWVEPVAPSNEEWKKYLEKPDTFEEAAKTD